MRNLTFAEDITVDERIDIIERAVVLSERQEDVRTIGVVRHQLGDLLNLRGDYDRAIVELERAVSLLDGIPERQAAALTSLGRTTASTR